MIMPDFMSQPWLSGLSGMLVVQQDRDGGYPNVAKVGGLQSQGARGEAVVAYCDPLVTKDLKSSGFPVRVNNRANRFNSGIDHRSYPEIV